MRTFTKIACCPHPAASSVGWDESTNLGRKDEDDESRMGRKDSEGASARPAEVDGTGPLTLPPRHRFQAAQYRFHAAGFEHALGERITCSSSTSCPHVGHKRLYVWRRRTVLNVGRCAPDHDVWLCGKRLCANVL